MGTKVSNPEPAQIGRRFLVTGTSGFLGTHFCRRLVNLGAEVHAVSRTERPSAGGLRWWRGNLLSQQENMYLLQAICPDVIVHLSGRVTAAHHVEEVLSTFESLLATTVNLLTAVAHWGAQPRVVLVGSLTEPPPGPDECTPGSPYVAAKWAASAYGRMFHALYETSVVIARPGMAYGPGQDPSKLIPYVMHSLLCGEAPQLSSGALSADWTYIDDMVDGLIATTRVPGIEGMTIDLGSGVLRTVRAVVHEIIAILDSPITPEWGALPDRPNEYVRAANAARTEGILGWVAMTSLRVGLKKTADWMQGSGSGPTTG